MYTVSAFVLVLARKIEPSRCFALRMPEKKNYSEFRCNECKEDVECLEGMAKHIV